MKDLFSEKLKVFRSLEFLSLRVRLIDREGLQLLFESTPTVHTLDLFIGSVTYGTALKILKAKKDLLPLLHTLVLGYPTGEGHEPSPDRIPPRALQSLLKARAAGVHPTSHIRKVIVWGDVSSEIGDGQDFVKVIRRFVERGEMVFERRFGRMEEMKVETWTLGRVGGRKLGVLRLSLGHSSVATQVRQGVNERTLRRTKIGCLCQILPLPFLFKRRRRFRSWKDGTSTLSRELPTHGRPRKHINW
jgi:hypothetical protein